MEPDQENVQPEKKPNTTVEVQKMPRTLTPREREHHDFVEMVIEHIQSVPDNPPNFQRTPRIEQLLNAFRDIARVESQKYIERMNALDEKYCMLILLIGCLILYICVLDDSQTLLSTSETYRSQA